MRLELRVLSGIAPGMGKGISCNIFKGRRRHIRHSVPDGLQVLGNGGRTQDRPKRACSGVRLVARD